MWRRSPVLFSSWACSTYPRLKSSLVGGKAKKTDSPVLFPPVGAIFCCAAHTHLDSTFRSRGRVSSGQSQPRRRRENCCVRPVTAHLNCTERLSQFSKHFLQDKKETLSSTTDPKHRSVVNKTFQATCSQCHQAGKVVSRASFRQPEVPRHSHVTKL